MQSASPEDLSAVPLVPALSREFLLHHRLCPRGIESDGTLVVLAAEDAITSAANEVGFAYQRRTRLENVPFHEIERLIERLHTQAQTTIELAAPDHAELDEASDARDLATQPPVIRYVNLLVRDAYEAGASDIHLEATRNGLRARFRMDGMLVQAMDAPAEMHQAVISRIKLLASLDIAERRRPQDGRIRVRLDDGDLDIRVSTVPTMHGESVVLRLLNQGGRPVELHELGMSADAYAAMELLTAKPHGMILVTGPTGSGKTTTLYAALSRRDAASEKIVTIEDPIEYQLPGVTQVPVHVQSGVTFGSVLRSVLRQDPDVLMIGEMRDRETAEIAVQAAMTGHLVFSTLHTNDAVSSLPRLIDLGIPRYLIAATVEGVLAQRLVRRVCASCATEYTPDRELLSRLFGNARTPGARFMRGVGCRECRMTGYRGRIGIFELLLIDDTTRSAIADDAPLTKVRDLAGHASAGTLRHDGWARVTAGITTVEEVVRVTQS